jgi:hypothetical protein
MSSSKTQISLIVEVMDRMDEIPEDVRKYVMKYPKLFNLFTDNPLKNMQRQTSAKKPCHSKKRKASSTQEAPIVKKLNKPSNPPSDQKVINGLIAKEPELVQEGPEAKKSVIHYNLVEKFPFLSKV